MDRSSPNKFNQFVPLIDRFFHQCIPEPNSGCWIWTGTTTWHPRKGSDVLTYGRIRVAGPQLYAHRVAWELFCSEIPAGLKVLHKCDNTLCVNPDHLFLGTQRDNIYDCELKGRAYHPSGVDNGAFSHGKYASGGEWYRDRPEKRRTRAR